MSRPVTDLRTHRRGRRECEVCGQVVAVQLGGEKLYRHKCKQEER